MFARMTKLGTNSPSLPVTTSHTHKKKLIISSCDGFGRVLHFPSPWRPFARPSVDCMLSIHSTYCVVRWQRGFFLSLSLFPFLFPPPGTDEKVSRKEREFHTHTHTHKVCKRNKEGRERLERESMLDSQMRVCTGIQETGKLPAIHTPWGVVLLRQRLLFQDLPPLLFNRQFKTVLGRPWTADTMQIDSGTPRKTTVDLLGPNRLLASKIQSIAFFLFLKVWGGRV